MNKPSSKRRRISPATALSKPFKSPLRRPGPTNTDDTPSKSVAPRTPDDAKVSATVTIPVESDSMLNTPSPTTTPVLPKRKRTLHLLSPLPSQSFQTSDPEILELQKQHREVQSKVDALIAKLELATQARNLETNTKYMEIPNLITKWRLASQDAADEVFVGAKERVDRMGGMAAWKEQSKRDATRWEFDEQRGEREHIDEDEGDLDNYDAEDSSGHLPKKNNGEESQAEEFTMEFMLKSLHVDPKLIGYDAEAQKWIKR
ncbi:hypothetical protein N7447_000050 [Penicillium robsamsonii]|uniref:uncharacterized protein n=1 Tax=Penicillium robsamsonii TaxID=1792511 RepID=UPI002546E609|nr:uncharacterized protein N7447_000050 [Penicillium robsamsonii]KAJ5834024.1 hypothetical protein N7447_000050 [Penicillium robsamsonii]